MTELSEKRIKKFVFVSRSHFSEKSRDSNQRLSDFRPNFDPDFAAVFFVVQVSELTSQSVDYLKEERKKYRKKEI